jgi:hypothetical protein
MIGQLNAEFPQLIETKEYNFNYECKSENLNEKFMKQLIKKAIGQIVRRLESVSRPAPEPVMKGLETSRKPSRNYLHLGDQEAENQMLMTTAKSNKSINSK